ncbi:MAG: hypothetical protein K6B40_05370 [Firmicutes bacterium]|nr:hypothetical protein [Bacillota bacterium]
MNFEQLKDQFAVLSGVNDCHNGDLYVWFNEAQTDLALAGGMMATADYTVAGAGEAFALPEGFLQLADCDRAYTLTPDGKIVFASPGQARLYYYRLPKDFSDAYQGECELAEIWHGLLPIFATSRFWDRESEGDGEESGHGSKWMKLYNDAKAKRLKTCGGWQRQLERWIVE